MMEITHIVSVRPSGGPIVGQQKSDAVVDLFLFFKHFFLYDNKSELKCFGVFFNKSLNTSHKIHNICTYSICFVALLSGLTTKAAIWITHQAEQKSCLCSVICIQAEMFQLKFMSMIDRKRLQSHFQDHDERHYLQMEEAW